MIGAEKDVQITPPAPTARAVGPCHTIIPILSRTPRHWKFTQHHRTTQPLPDEIGKIHVAAVFSYDHLRYTMRIFREL